MTAFVAIYVACGASLLIWAMSHRLPGEETPTLATMAWLVFLWPLVLWPLIRNRQ